MLAGDRQSLLVELPAAVHSEVLSLLTAHQSAGAFLITPEDGWLRIGERIGPYRIVEKIGHGGMGVVWRARRDDGEFHREVAMRLVGDRQIAPGADRRLMAELRRSTSCAYSTV